MQHYEPSTTAHVVRQLTMVVVAFRTTIPNCPSIIMLFGCFRCLDFRTKDLLPYFRLARERPLFVNTDMSLTAAGAAVL
jgi:hypothetical protein